MTQRFVRVMGGKRWPSCWKGAHLARSKVSWVGCLPKDRSRNGGKSICAGYGWSACDRNSLGYAKAPLDFK